MAGKEEDLQDSQHGVNLDREQFCCSVCLDLLKEPVTVHCGHSYCRGCIESCWDGQGEREEYSCPQCRETFHPRPVLKRNNMLAEVRGGLCSKVVEKLKMSYPQPPPPSLTLAAPPDVACDFCSLGQNKATKSCLTCLASYCDEHAEPHYTVPVLQKHELISATMPVGDKVCTEHRKLMDLCCQTDEQLICTECTVDKHKGHQFVSVLELKETTKERLEKVRKQVQEKVQQREEELETIIQAEKNVKSSAQTSKADCAKAFSELISSVQNRRSKLEQLIEAQEKSALAQAGALKQQLEKELGELRGRDAQLLRLSSSDDVVYLTQLNSISIAFQDFALGAGPPRSFTDVTACVTELKAKADILLKETWPKISTTVSYVDFSLPPAPNSREEFLRYWRPLTLDDTSNYINLNLMDNKRKIRPSPIPYPTNPNRFTQFPQVLCTEALTERCYWEVEWHARTLSAAVAYKDANRTSDESEFGRNDKSWALECSGDTLKFRHNDVDVKVPGSCSKKIGVFLDYQAGILSFYQASDQMLQIFEVRTTFTEPLHPGIGMNYEWYDTGVFAQLAKLK
ncbi:tripartite motif-containing protein 16-like isoform X1 [Xiphophorus couchianus]|uniref:tripartite motif-containing protein 16-like isoform X1 n=1 Tax=Xiphophorus couchianus TaxID=32473 RepID=UPI00101655EF|nr:tripartite motif-containing protein 16-like isoform X1 [Xiphophorus couchianus]XP_027893718.1 tripartite motif-containing protein 16-like isoform X1 [Xiphophorus couchianus]